MNRGVLYAAGAYALWGLMPVYWKWLQEIPATLLISHRVVWSFFTLIAIVLLLRQGRGLVRAAGSASTRRTYFASSLLIGVNWLIYVWAVNSGHVVETSLGYFINPLLSVLLGVIFLGERLRPVQWASAGLAAAGILVLTLRTGTVPWIALGLALTFAFYGLVKKRAPLNALDGLTLETGALFPPALAYAVAGEAGSHPVFTGGDPGLILLIMSAGVVTTAPLLLFGAAVQRIPLNLAGMLQYIAPTLQFLLGVLLYGEPFTGAQQAGFGLVWAALVLYSFDSWRAWRVRSAAAAARAGAGR